MKTNNIASYSDVLVTCMRQNPRWILLSEVRSAEAVLAVRNSISSGHNILSTIHADKAESIPSRLYSLLESNIDLEQFLRSIHRYVQLGVHVKGYYSKEKQKFHREIAEVVEFYVTEDNEPKTNILYKKTPDGKITLHNPTKYLLDYLESQGLIMQPDILVKEEFKPLDEYKVDNSKVMPEPLPNQNLQPKENIINPQPINNRIVTNLNNQNQMNINPNQNVNRQIINQNIPNYNLNNQNYNQVNNRQVVIQPNQNQPLNSQNINNIQPMNYQQVPINNQNIPNQMYINQNNNQ